MRSMSLWGVMHIVIGCYSSPLQTVSAMHHADHLGILGADDWTGGDQQVSRRQQTSQRASKCTPSNLTYLSSAQPVTPRLLMAGIR